MNNDHAKRLKKTMLFPLLFEDKAILLLIRSLLTVSSCFVIIISLCVELKIFSVKIFLMFCHFSHLRGRSLFLFSSVRTQTEKSERSFFVFYKCSKFSDIALLVPFCSCNKISEAYTLAIKSRLPSFDVLL